MNTFKEMASELGDMKVGQILIDSEDWGDESDPLSSWNVIQTLCTHSHRDSCEFIVCVKGYCLEEIEKSGLSDYIKELCRNASDDGYDYLCLYTC